MKKLLLSFLFTGLLLAQGPFGNPTDPSKPIQGSVDTSVKGDPKALAQRAQAADIAKLKKIQAVFFEGKKSPFAVAHAFKVKFTAVSDYRALYGLLSYLSNEDFSENDFDYIARTLDDQETHMLAQLP